MREHVVELAGDPAALADRRRLELFLARVLELGEQQLSRVLTRSCLFDEIGDERQQRAEQYRGEDDARTAYRLYEIQNGNHLETNQLLFSQLELIQPHAQKSFDLLVEQVENGRKLPPSQCVPRGGAIAEAPAQPGHCASLFVP